MYRNVFCITYDSNSLGNHRMMKNDQCITVWLNLIRTENVHQPKTRKLYKLYFVWFCHWHADVAHVKAAGERRERRARIPVMAKWMGIRSSRSSSGMYVLFGQQCWLSCSSSAAASPVPSAHDPPAARPSASLSRAASHPTCRQLCLMAHHQTRDANAPLLNAHITWTQVRVKWVDTVTVFMYHISNMYSYE